MKNQKLTKIQFPPTVGPLGLDPVSSRPVPLNSGSDCPECGKGKLDYNGLLELECPVCGFRNGGWEGCT